MLVTDEIFKKSEESTAVCSRIAIMIIHKTHTNGQKTKNEKTGPEIPKKQKKKNTNKFERGFL